MATRIVCADCHDPLEEQEALVRKLRRNLQPFRMYVHGNPMQLPSPSLMAHWPPELPPRFVRVRAFLYCRRQSVNHHPE